MPYLQAFRCLKRVIVGAGLRYQGPSSSAGPGTTTNSRSTAQQASRQGNQWTAHHQRRYSLQHNSTAAAWGLQRRTKAQQHSINEQTFGRTYERANSRSAGRGYAVPTYPPPPYITLFPHTIFSQKGYNYHNLEGTWNDSL